MLPTRDGEMGTRFGSGLSQGSSSASAGAISPELLGSAPRQASARGRLGPRAGAAQAAGQPIAEGGCGAPALAARRGTGAGCDLAARNG